MTAQACPVGAALLLLADGRLPAGGHAHSGGVEPAVTRGLVRDVATLGEFLRGRLHTAGATAAVLAAAACRAATGPAAAVRLDALDAEADARMPSPAVRAASRSQGRALLRLALRAWPSPVHVLLGPRPHHPLALGTACAAAGLSPEASALLAATGAVGGPASAAVRLLGLDPLAVTALQARLGPAIDRVARDAALAAVDDPSAAPAAPLLDLLAEEHAALGVPLFAS